MHVKVFSDVSERNGILCGAYIIYLDQVILETQHLRSKCGTSISEIIIASRALSHALKLYPDNIIISHIDLPKTDFEGILNKYHTNKDIITYKQNIIKPNVIVLNKIRKHPLYYLCDGAALAATIGRKFTKGYISSQLALSDKL